MVTSPQRLRPDARDVAADDRFDAFISYRHGGDDHRAAVRLQEALLAYRTPRPLVKAGKPRRLLGVFRDEEVLHAAPSLRREIDEALRRSRFLIVLCSPRLVEKPDWVRREVERFRELRGEGKILSLMLSGASKDAIPDWLGPDPLAASIRSDRDRDRMDLRLLRTERLRLLAPLLDCDLRELTRREEQRTRRRHRAWMAASTSLAGGFMALSAGLFVSRNEVEVKRLELEGAYRTEARLNEDLKRNQVEREALTGGIWRLTSSPLGSVSLDPTKISILAETLFPEMPNDRMRFEALAVHQNGAIDQVEAMLASDPQNVNLMNALRTYCVQYMGTLGLLHDAGGEVTLPRTQEQALERSQALARQIALENLLRWTPRAEEPDLPWNEDFQLRLLEMRMDGHRKYFDGPPQTRAFTRGEFAQSLADYLPYLETWTPEGLAKARDALDEGERLFEPRPGDPPLTADEQAMREAIQAARRRVGETTER